MLSLVNVSLVSSVHTIKCEITSIIVRFIYLEIKMLVLLIRICVLANIKICRTIYFYM